MEWESKLSDKMLEKCQLIEGPGHIGAEVRSQNGDFRPFRPQGVGAHSSTLGSVWTKLFGFRPHCGYDILTDGHCPQYISDL